MVEDSHKLIGPAAPNVPHAAVRALETLTDGELFGALLELCPTGSALTYSKKLDGVGSLHFTVSKLSCEDCVTHEDLGNAIKNLR